MTRRDLTQETLFKLVTYNPETGIFNRVGFGGKRSGTISEEGYRAISVYEVKHLEHRLAWLYMTGLHPPIGMQVDHINSVRDDNRWGNLRLATPSENLLYRKLSYPDRPGSGASGVLGVYWDGRKNRWHVQFTRKGKMYYGGYHVTISDAKAAVLKLKLEVAAAASGEEVSP